MWMCDWTWRQGVCPADTIEREGFGAVWLKAGGASVGDSTNGYRERFVDPTFLEGARKIRQTGLVLGAYWYLTPGRLATQAGLFYDILLEATGSKRHVLRYVAPKLDVEEPGLGYEDVAEFCAAWADLSDAHPFMMYTNRNLWTRMLPIGSNGSGVALTPFLEEAHWVPQSVREDPARPYASQQAKAIPEDWWRLPNGSGTQFGYAGWTEAMVIQFTNNALIAEHRQMASLYRGSQVDFRSRLTRS